MADNKISLDLDETIKEKINAALQKPTGLTKTKLVGVGTQGQENIEIGDNLTLANGKISAASEVGVVELTASQAHTLTADKKITFTAEQAEVIKSHQLIQMKYADAVYKGLVSRVFLSDAFAYTISIFLGPYMYTIRIRDFTEEQTLYVVSFPTGYTFDYNTSIKAIGWSDGDFTRYVYLATINGNPIAFNTEAAAKNYSFTEDKAVPFLGKHSVLVPKTSADTSILPCTADDNGKVLSVVNGEAK